MTKGIIMGADLVSALATFGLGCALIGAVLTSVGWSIHEGHRHK